MEAGILIRDSAASAAALARPAACHRDSGPTLPRPGLRRARRPRVQASAWSKAACQCQTVSHCSSDPGSCQQLTQRPTLSRTVTGTDSPMSRSD
jgi:hypothetical protein